MVLMELNFIYFILFYYFLLINLIQHPVIRQETRYYYLWYAYALKMGLITIKMSIKKTS